MKTSIAIAVDNRRLAHDLSVLIPKLEHFHILFVAENSRDLLSHLKRGQVPDIVLMDLSRSERTWFDTASQIKQRYPGVRVLALSMTDPEGISRQWQFSGSYGYLLSPLALSQALEEIRLKGHHYSEQLTDHLIRSQNPAGPSRPGLSFTFSGREYEFLKMACSDLTYAQIADKMCVSTRTVDGYRESLFQKMNVKSRVGMAIEAIRWGLVQV